MALEGSKFRSVPSITGMVFDMNADHRVEHFEELSRVKRFWWLSTLFTTHKLRKKLFP